jgi:hypothetical protein
MEFAAYMTAILFKEFDMKRTGSFLRRGILPLIVAAAWTACASPASSPPDNSGAPEQPKDELVSADPGDTADAELVPASKDINALGLASPVVINFNGDSAPTVTAGANAEVNAETNHVAVTLTAADANIVAQGVCADGSITLAGNYAFNLYLNGLELASLSGAAINNDGSKAMNVTLVAEGHRTG